MNYGQVSEYLSRAEAFGSIPGLSRIARLTDELENPQRGMPFVHIAGTNGKGSTAAYISEMLRAAGYRTGLYTSPYIRGFGERVRVNGEVASEDGIAETMTDVIEASERIIKVGGMPPTVFEMITAMGFLYFRRQNCDITVLEVGLGGRLDATNIIDPPLAAVLTRIGLDHTELLGQTVAEIAAEKAGIIKPGCAAVLMRQSAEAEDTVSAICGAENVPLFRADAGVARLRSIATDGICFDWENYEGLETGMTGLFQIQNAVTATRTAQVLEKLGWAIDESAVRAGLKKARCAGRLEILSEKPIFLTDGAHNPQGAAALAESLSVLFPGKKFLFVIGVLADKDYRGILAETLPFAKRVYAVTPPVKRALSAFALKEETAAISAVPAEAFDTPEAGIFAALNAAGKDDVICAFGSLYQIAGIRAFFGKTAD